MYTSTFHSPDPRPISYVCRLDHAIRGAPSVQNAARCSPSENELCRAVARASWQGFGSRYHKRTAFKFNSKARGAGNFPAVSFMNSCRCSLRSPSPRSRSVAATALDSRRDSGTNCPGNCWSSCCTCGNARAAARHRGSSGSPSAEGPGANLCTKTACDKDWAYKSERTQTRCTPRAAPLLRWLESGVGVRAGERVDIGRG